MNKTVFISSTYDDLNQYRRAIWDLLEKFQVNVRGMEQFGARKEAPLATCLSEVEQSDIYLGVIAFRQDLLMHRVENHLPKLNMREHTN